MTKNAVDPGWVGGGVLTIGGHKVWLRRMQSGGGQRFVAFPLEVREQLGLIRGSVCRMWIEENIVHIQVIDPSDLAPHGGKP